MAQFNAAQNPLLNDFQGGQMTDLPAYASGLDLTGLFEIVSPGTAAAGVNYSITMQLLAQLIGQAIALQPTVVTIPVYPSVATDTRILMELAAPATATITLLSSLSYLQPVLVKDAFGTASLATPMNVVFTGGQLADGLATVSIQNPYGGFWFNPLPSGGFYLTAA
jgi:hypothetical protein